MATKTQSNAENMGISQWSTVFRALFVGKAGNMADALFDIAAAIRYFADVVKAINAPK